MSRDSYYQPAMRSAGAMSAVQGLLALTMLSLTVGSACAANNIESRNTTSRPWQFSHTSLQSLAVSCLPDIKDTEAYKIEHPICSNLAKKHHRNVMRARCASVLRRPMNVTLHWERAPARAASALLAALLRHVLGYQRVHLAPKNKHLGQFNQADELVISLAAVFEDDSHATPEASDQLVAYDKSSVPSRWRLHAWLTPAARSDSACRSTNWTFYSNMTALALCGFIDDYSFDVTMAAMEVVCVGDNCKTTMQRLQKRAKAAGIPARAIYVNRTDFERDRLTSPYSFLFLDFDIWRGEPSVNIVEPPPYVSDSDGGIYQSELDYSTGILIADRRIEKDNNRLSELVHHFKPTPESLRAILEREANGVNLEEAACEWAENYKSYVSEEVFEKVNHLGFMKPNDSKNIQVLTNTFVAVYLCFDGRDINLYDKTIMSVGNKIYNENPRGLNIAIVRYFVNCSDPEHMGRRLDELMQGPRASSMLGVVSLSVEGATAASVAAATHRVPLLLAAAVPDMSVRGSSTWRVAGRLRHVAQALHKLFAMSDASRVAVLSQPTTFARHYFGELRYIAQKRKTILRNFKIPLDLTEQLAMEALQDLQATKTRVVLVNTDSDTAALILTTAVKLNMSYTDGFIWVLREPETRPECRMIHFTVSLSNLVMEGISREQVQMLGVDEMVVVPPHGVAIANALMTVSSGFNNIFQQHPDLLTDLRSGQVIRAFENSLKETPVTGFNGVQLHYKERAIEEAYVYVDKWGGYLCKPQRLATWRVNVTSGSVRDQEGGQPTLSLDFSVTRVPDSNSSDSGERSDAAGGSNGEEGGSVGTEGRSGGAEGGSGGAEVGSGGAAGGKLHIIVSDKPVNASNTTYIVRQWIQSITKIETPSGTSESDILNFYKFNHFNNNID